MVQIPRWLSISFIPVEFAVALMLAPYALSLLAVRHGWKGELPGPWNLVGLALGAVGAMGLAWGVGRHVANLPPLVEVELTPKYLLKGGPYRFSRNPIYLAVLTTWLGWTITYGSVANAIVFLMASILFVFVVVPFEERRLERRFGDDYRQYKKTVAGWEELGHDPGRERCHSLPPHSSRHVVSQFSGKRCDSGSWHIASCVSQICHQGSCHGSQTSCHPRWAGFAQVRHCRPGSGRVLVDHRARVAERFAEHRNGRPDRSRASLRSVCWQR
jgi:protein-S-isoprenylcysteine O-methyltransferase Ste14